MKKRFYKTGEVNSSINVKKPLRSSALINNKNEDKFCLIWSILAEIHLCGNDHLDRVSKYRKYFDEIKIDGFVFPNGFKCSDIHKFEKLNNLSLNKFELYFYQDRNKWKHNFFPIEISKND